MPAPPPPPPAPATGVYRGSGAPAPDLGYYTEKRAHEPVDPDEWRPTAVVAAPKPPATRKIVPAIVFLAAAVAAFLGVRALLGQDPIVNTGADGEIQEVTADSFFVPVAGHTYQNPPPQLVQQMESVVASVDTGGTLEMDARLLTTPGSPPALVLVGAMDVAVAREGAEDAIAGFEAGSGVSVERIDLSDGSPAFKGEIAANGMTGDVVVGFYENLMWTVTAQVPGDAEKIASELVAAQS